MKKIIFILTQIFYLFMCYAQTKLYINTEYEKGLIVDNQKKSNWEYFDEPNKLSIKFNYTTEKLIHIEKDTTPYYIYKDNSWVYEKVDIQPRIIGSMKFFNESIYKNILYPQTAIYNNICREVFLTFEVDTNGVSKIVNIQNDEDDIFKSTIINTFNNLNYAWIPAVKNKNKYVSRFVIPFDFRIENSGQNCIYKNKNKTIPQGKLIDTVVITIVKTN